MLVSISDEDSLSEIALSHAYKLASTHFSLFYRSVHVLYTGIHLHNLEARQKTPQQKPPRHKPPQQKPPRQKPTQYATKTTPK